MDLFLSWYGMSKSLYNSYIPIFQKSIKKFLKPYGHGKFIGGSKKCKWDHISHVNVRCHVGKRGWIDWTTDYPCTKSEKKMDQFSYKIDLAVKPGSA